MGSSGSFAARVRHWESTEANTVFLGDSKRGCWVFIFEQICIIIMYIDYLQNNSLIVKNLHSSTFSSLSFHLQWADKNHATDYWPPLAHRKQHLCYWSSKSNFTFPQARPKQSWNHLHRWTWSFFKALEKVTTAWTFTDHSSKQNHQMIMVSVPSACLWLCDVITVMTTGGCVTSVGADPLYCWGVQEGAQVNKIQQSQFLNEQEAANEFVR